MKTKAITVKTYEYEFCFPQLDTLVQVEETAGEVIVRATRDTFSLDRKILFIRELAAEGFIPDQYRWFALPEQPGACGVCWRVDYSWLKYSDEMVARTRRFMIRLFSGGAILWLVMMVLLFLRAGR
jgi:hypothetical protein